MMKSIEHPRFGKINYSDDGLWAGAIHLPHFDLGKPDEESTDDARRASEREAVVFPLAHFELQIEDVTGDGPSPEQEAAYEFLIEHESDVLNAVLKWTFNFYMLHIQEWRLDGLRIRDDRFMPALQSPDGLKDKMELGSVLIHEQPRDGIAPITFYFRCDWDEEHGLEVATHRDQVIEMENVVMFPFPLPAGVDASAIEPESEGHRCVELKIAGRWSGIYVIDPQMQCVGIVKDSYPRQFLDLEQIQDVRAVSGWRRRLVSLPREQIMKCVAAGNWLVALPCLILGWLYFPVLFWICIALSCIFLIIYRWYFRYFSTNQPGMAMCVVQIVASIAGLIYAFRGASFGSDEHVSGVLGVLGWIVWAGACVIALLATMVLVGVVFAFDKNFIRHGLVSLGAALLFWLAVVGGLAATALTDWSQFYLCWLVPVAFAISLILVFGSLTGLSSAGTKAVAAIHTTNCPHCGKPLATAKAKQCLHCGGDWHGQN